MILIRRRECALLTEATGGAGGGQDGGAHSGEGDGLD